MGVMEEFNRLDAEAYVEGRKNAAAGRRENQLVGKLLLAGGMFQEDVDKLRMDIVRVSDVGLTAKWYNESEDSPKYMGCLPEELYIHHTKIYLDLGKFMKTPTSCEPWKLFLENTTQHNVAAMIFSSHNLGEWVLHTQDPTIFDPICAHILFKTKDCKYWGTAILQSLKEYMEILRLCDPDTGARG